MQVPPYFIICGTENSICPIQYPEDLRTHL